MSTNAAIEHTKKVIEQLHLECEALEKKLEDRKSMLIRNQIHLKNLEYILSAKINSRLCN